MRLEDRLERKEQSLEVKSQDLDKKYSEVRSTLSEYISFLVDHNLVRKYRKGKESYAGITERGLELLKQLDKDELEAIDKKED